MLLLLNVRQGRKAIYKNTVSSNLNYMPGTIKEIHIFNNGHQLVDFATRKWTELAGAGMKTKGFFSVALSGGKTPVALYNRLSGEKALPWPETHVFMVDERFVPYESDENNYHMINRTLLSHVDIATKNVHPILTSELSPKAAAERYEQDLAAYCRTVGARFPRFDLILLGIGEDGHTASLFPGTASLKETRCWAVSVCPPGPSKRARITLTFPVINNAENIIFMVEGEKKAGIMKEVIQDESNSLPAAMVRPLRGKIIFLLDERAGCLLSKK
ncbi:MAG: 6-phosphogluconolactonase [Nitrospirae bacterium]|nr:6-phosphogluconolactonase [Nitrospirota bacterium]